MINNTENLQLHSQPELERRLGGRSSDATIDASDGAIAATDGFAIISASGFAIISASGFAII